ncbi:MAG TPA: peptidoglycan DD-metalloendopeptidase family protein [Burkholderiales bacterium]|nr:peptidoglycan DD-metalloendopeptidase family protein [Burkholderiales bacterium]
MRTLILGGALLFGGVAAFGTVNDAPPPAGQTIVEALALSMPVHSDATEEIYWREDRFAKGDTFASFLARLGVNADQSSKLVRQRQLDKTFRALTPGTSVQVKTNAAGDLISLEFVSARNTLVGFERKDEGFQGIEEQVPLTRIVKIASGEISSSLFAATDNAGLPDSVSMQMADIFSGDVDFHRGLRRGDRFSVVYEMLYYEGRAVKAGRVLGAEFINNGRSFRAVWFGDHEGRGGYYTPEGKNLRKAFLRSPLEFSRVTSGFAMRVHPTQGGWRQHKGVDYGAPTGTRIRATADGTVDLVGKQNGYGNVVVLRHQGSVTTLYAHLSGFAGGLRKGMRVSQGDVIGYVGATGWATGSHLHYEFRVGNQHRNPLTVVMPAADPLPPHRLQAFKAQVRDLSGPLNLLSNVALVSAD